MRALIVSNMYPSPERPALGSFVRDQVRALQRRGDVDVELYAFAPGGAIAYARAATELRRRYRETRFDVVHAHFGLTAWPALAVRADRRVLTMHGTDLANPRSRAITLAGLRTIEIPAVVSAQLAAEVPSWATRREPLVLPCGVDLERFRPRSRREARRQLGLDPDGRYLLFPADPSRPEKRFDRAREAAEPHALLTLGSVAPEEMPLWVSAADGVLVTSERESFGLAVLEALACGVPVASTPGGIAPEAMAGVSGALCAPFDRALWAAWVADLMALDDPRIEGRAAAERFSADRMADRVVTAWREGR